MVDEYDCPIINKLNDIEVAKKNRDILKGFFSTIKGLDNYLEFSFVTGVSKFSQVSLLNNLTDISLNPDYGEIMGYSEVELQANFAENLREFS